MTTVQPPPGQRKPLTVITVEETPSQQVFVPAGEPRNCAEPGSNPSSHPGPRPPPADILSVNAWNILVCPLHCTSVGRVSGHALQGMGPRLSFDMYQACMLVHQIFSMAKAHIFSKRPRGHLSPCAEAGITCMVALAVQLDSIMWCSNAVNSKGTDMHSAFLGEEQLHRSSPP